MEDGDVYEELKRLRAKNALLEESCDLALDKVAAQSAALAKAKAALAECDRYGSGYTNCYESYLPPLVRTKVSDALAAIEALPSAPKQTQTSIDVLAEWKRQTEVEGWTPEHDDAHDDNALSWAAACYALSSMELCIDFGEAYVTQWPTEWQWKPSTPRRNLIKAGALILAEIERIDRAAASKGGE